MLVHRSKETGQLIDWPEQYQVEKLVAESRSKRTQDWRLTDGRLLETYELSSGNIEVTEINQISEYLTVRY